MSQSDPAATLYTEETTDDPKITLKVSGTSTVIVLLLVRVKTIDHLRHVDNCRGDHIAATKLFRQQ